MITCDFYEKFVKGLNRSDVVHVPTEEIPKFFVNTPDNAKLTVVSSYSDYSIRYQAENHPNKDLIKRANVMNWANVCGVTDKYMAVQLGPTCEIDNCNASDTYCIKVDRHTIGTFSRIPAGIRWFCTNLDICHPQATWLPFGVNNDGHGKDILMNYAGRKKRGLLYVNFQNNSFDRVRIKNHFRNQPWVTFRENANLSIEQYYEEMSEHQFVASPFGNGLDCYRNYEALYLGVIPIVDYGNMSNYMIQSGLRVYQCDDWSKLNQKELDNAYYLKLSRPSNGLQLKTVFWESMISMTNAFNGDK